MSLSSLKKSTQSDRPRLVTVDQFIDDAVSYAHGIGGNYMQRKALHVIEGEKERPTKMRRATFTLTEDVMDKLTVISERTGIAKSRLIRILVTRQIKRLNDNALLDSKVR